jgi:hypothetical protein
VPTTDPSNDSSTKASPMPINTQASGSNHNRVRAT